MKRILAVSGAGAVILAWSAWQPQARSTSAAVADDVRTLLVQFAVGDNAPDLWNGEVSAVSGQVVRLSSWRPLPSDSMEGERAWKLASTWSDTFQNRSWEREPMVPYGPYLRRPGLVVEVRGESPVLTFKTSHGQFDTGLSGGAFLDGRVYVQPVPSPVRVSVEDRENEHVALARGTGREMWLGWVTYANGANQVVVRRHDGREWSASQTLTGASSDVFRVQLGAGTKSGVWAVWNEQVNGNWDLYGAQRQGDGWSRTQRLTDAPQPDIRHALAADSEGNLWLVWQGFRQGQSDIFVRRHDGKNWSAPERLSTSPANDWSPAIAADGKGRVHVAWDTYDKGDYDVVMRTFAESGWSAQRDIATSLKFEAKVALACDGEDRVWAAWNESGLQWGKDTGLLLRRQATPLYSERFIATAVLSDGKWMEPVAPLEESLPADLRNYNESMALAPDGQGRMWLLFRHRVPRIPGVLSEAALHGAAWEVWATSYEGDRWSKPVVVPASSGRSDMATAAIAGADGQLRIAWSSDTRDYDATIHRRAEVYSGSLPALGTAPSVPVLAVRTQPVLRSFSSHPNKKQDLERIRGYAISTGGSTYRIYRGDIHRHTEISRDGKNDGSLWDTYRYALDAASLDFLGVSDHNEGGGPDIEYINYLLQQAADVFFLSGRFTPLYGYERSLSFPNGHRNVMFAKRGIPTLRIPPEEKQAKTGAQALYAYLRKNRGIAVSHTSATGMGTDWRDNDPEVEPLVEIYQGDRVSAEHEGAPKAATRHDPTSHAGGFRPEGYVWNAWAKGYKFGVQASSDHLSTHISYACTLATGSTREDLIEAMRKRHSYGATDNIILDYRLQSGGREYIQGDIAPVKGGFRLYVKIIGTAAIRQIDIIRNNTYLHNRQHLGPETEFTFIDNDPLPGESYYYVRVMQTNEQMAWSSPIWVQR
jgi:hypothetical protein